MARFIALTTMRHPFACIRRRTVRSAKSCASRWGWIDYDLDAALDPEEIPRLEFGAHGAANIIWKRPKNVSVGAQLRFDVSSMGMFIRPDAVVLVTADSEPDFGERDFRGVHTLSDFLLKLLLHTVHHYLGHLKGHQADQCRAGQQDQRVDGKPLLPADAGAVRESDLLRGMASRPTWQC